jgi:uncharacterized protein
LRIPNPTGDPAVSVPPARDRDGVAPDPFGGDRDRDGAGRARNARPRDGLGRPLARSAAAGDPSTAGAEVPRIPDDLTVSPAQAAELGGRLLAQGRPFHAHEVFEAAWKSAPGPGRELWRGLAQIAVGLTHARRGNALGAVSLLRRGAGHVAAFAGEPGGGGEPQGGGESGEGIGGIEGGGIDAGFVAANAAGIADRIERDGLASLPDEVLLLPLRRHEADA